MFETSDNTLVENTENLQLSSPWEIYRKRVFNIFDKDPEVEVDKISSDVVDGVFTFSIKSANSAKLAAIEKILKNDVSMGNITVHINFEYENDGAVTSEDFEAAFEGNPLFDAIYASELPTGGDVNYVVFNREIITYFNDDLTDYCGNGHEIAADIVRDIVKENIEISICTKTDAPEDEDDLEEEDE